MLHISKIVINFSIALVIISAKKSLQSDSKSLCDFFCYYYFLSSLFSKSVSVVSNHSLKSHLLKICMLLLLCISFRIHIIILPSPVKLAEKI